MEQVFQNKDLNTSVRTVKDKGEVFFYARDVAKALGYKRPEGAVLTHVWNRNKVILEYSKGTPDLGVPSNRQPSTIFFRESGVYQLLIFKSKLPAAEDFQ